MYYICSITYITNPFYHHRVHHLYPYLYYTDYTSIYIYVQIYCGSVYTIARMRCEDDSAYAACLLNSSPPCLPELL